MTQVVLQEDRRQISLGGGVNYAYAFPATCRPSQTDASSITDLVSPFANVPSEKHRIAGRSIHPPTGKRAQQATIMGKSLQIAGIATRRQERGSSSGRAAASSADSLTAHVGDVQYVRISPPSASASAGTSPGQPAGPPTRAAGRRPRRAATSTAVARRLVTDARCLAGPPARGVRMSLLWSLAPQRPAARATARAVPDRSASRCVSM